MSILTIHHTLQSLDSIFIIDYVNDVTLGGPQDIVAYDVNSVIAE